MFLIFAIRKDPVVYILIHISLWICALIAVAWISGSRTVGSWDIYILILIDTDKLYIEIFKLILFWFFIPSITAFFLFLSIQREIWPSISPWVSKSKWKLKVCNSQVSAKPSAVLNFILAWRTWVSPRLPLEWLSALWTVGHFFSLVLKYLWVTASPEVCRSADLSAGPLHCFLPSLEHAIILEVNKSKN